MALSYAFAENFLQTLTSGLMIGCVYGLMCIGLAMIFSVMRVINFAQGDFMMLGMYVAYGAFTMLGLSVTLGTFLAPVASALLAGAALFLFGYVVHTLLIARVTGLRVAQSEGDGHYAQLILTLGLALVLQNAGMIIFGSETTAIRTPLSHTAFEIGPLFGNQVSVFVNEARSQAAVVSIATTVGLFLIVSYTLLGKSLRAAADNPQSAIYMGVDVDRAHRLAFAIGSAVTGIAGGLIASYQSFQPYVGLDYVIVMYAGVVLGGMGSILGAFWGGLAIGLVQQLSTIVLPIQLQNTTVFIVFLLVILLRPNGFFGRSVERT